MIRKARRPLGRGLGETVVKANPMYAVFDPGGALKNDLGLVKGLVHAEDWRSDRPGLGFGENLFDVATLFVPGAGEAGAGWKGLRREHGPPLRRRMLLARWGVLGGWPARWEKRRAPAVRWPISAGRAAA